MRKEQLIRIFLALLLASATLTLSSCRKEQDPKDKDPKVALVNTRWQLATDIPGFDLGDDIGEVSGELAFTSSSEGELTLGIKGLKVTFSLTYSYDATQKAYIATAKVENETQQFLMKVNWDTKILTIYELENGVASPKPEAFFRLIQ